MTIGKAARRASVSARMIRHDAQIGPIPPAPRREQGYRDQSDRDVHILRFIRRARDLGFGMAGIARLLDLGADRNRQASEVKAIAAARLAEIQARIGEMRAMATTRARQADGCAGDERPDGPILDDLATAPPAPRPRRRAQLS
jgi:Cu(I)-responsive transcriptional regulator